MMDMDTSIRVIGEVTLADGICRHMYERDGLQYVVDDDGQLVYGAWLVVEKEEPCSPCDLPVIVYDDQEINT
jgi:hypothetical protein